MKKWWTSKQIWFNILVAIIFGAQSAFEQQLIPEKLYLWIALIGNTLIRAFWTQKKLTS